MKRKIICLLLAVLMISSLVLTSCGNKESDDQKRKENICAGDTALTLTLWIPVDATAEEINNVVINVNGQEQVVVSEFNKRVDAVEAAINQKLASKNTRIELIVVSNEEYEAKLMEQFNISKNSTAQKPSEVGKTYVNEAIMEEGDTFYSLKYPTVLSNQIDICLIRDYETFNKLVSDNALHSLNSYVTSESASYPRFRKIIKNEFLTPLTVNKNLYALPNNRAYVQDEYQYILINKELAESAEASVDADNIQSILDCAEIIDKIGELNASGVVPFVGTENDAPGLIYWAGEQSTIVSSNGTVAPESIFDNEAYMKYTSLYKALCDKNYVKSELAEGEIAGVMIYNGTMVGAEAYADDYYLVKTDTPVLREEDAYASMFAISEYSINYDRAMSFLYLLHTNEEIRTLLQYGIENVDYYIDKTGEKEDDPTIEILYEQGKHYYNMNNAYTGNGYITYRDYGSVIDDWSYIKKVNYDATISKYFHFQTNYNNGASATEKAEVTALAEKLNTFNSNAFAKINAMSSAEFELFRTTYSAAKEIDISAVEKELSDKFEEYNAIKPLEQEKKDKLEQNLAQIEANKDDADKADEIATLEAENVELQKDLDAIVAYDKLLADKELFNSNDLVLEILTNEDYSKALEKFASLNTTYNK